MAKTVLNGGTATTQDQFTGEKNELTVDESNQNLRLHDGSTPGGKTLLTKDNAADVFQARSVELDGFVELEPQERGFLARQGPADYQLRKLTVNVLQMTVDFEDGFEGNPILGLAATIGTQHTWSEQQIFQDVVQFDAGLNGDVAGDLTGNVTGNVTGNLTGNSAGTHTGPTVGDVDVRGETLLLDNNQIPISAIAGLVAAIRLNGFPIGGIILWSGSFLTIPTGWVLCDGTNGTPNLVDKFIVGAGNGSSVFDVADIGGNLSHTHTAGSGAAGSHSHAITVDDHALSVAEIPSHSHPNGVVDNNDSVFNRGSAAAAPTKPSSIETNSPDGVTEGVTGAAGSGDPHAHTASSASAGSHAHAVTVDSTDILPPFYALCYIMRIAD